MKRFIKEYLLENWTLKTTAVLLALILWLFVRGEPGPERVVPVPLEVQVPPHMEITNERPPSVYVTVLGAAFSSSCVIDLRGAEEGRHVVTLSSDNIRIPKGSGIKILRINPARVTLELERTLSREVPIVVPIRGEPPRGYEIYGKSTKPSTVVVTGPRTQVESLRDVPTEAVALNGQKQPTRFFLSLNLKDGAIRTSVVNPVQVDIQIGLRRKLFTIEHVPVTIDNVAYTAAPRHISVQVLGSPDAVENLTPADFAATVETKNLDDSKLPVNVKPVVRVLGNKSGALAIRDIQPPEITVRRRK